MKCEEVKKKNPNQIVGQVVTVKKGIYSFFNFFLYSIRATIQPTTDRSTTRRKQLEVNWTQKMHNIMPRLWLTLHTQKKNSVLFFLLYFFVGQWWYGKYKCSESGNAENKVKKWIRRWRKELRIESLHKGDQGWTTGLLDYHDRREKNWNKIRMKMRKEEKSHISAARFWHEIFFVSPSGNIFTEWAWDMHTKSEISYFAKFAMSSRVKLKFHFGMLRNNFPLRELWPEKKVSLTIARMQFLNSSRKCERECEIAWLCKRSSFFGIFHFSFGEFGERRCQKSWNLWDKVI